MANGDLAVIFRLTGAIKMWTKHTCASCMLEKVKSNTHTEIYTQNKKLF